jgi:HlyD family secretion protein
MFKKKYVIILGSIVLLLILVAVFSKKEKKGIKVSVEKVELRNITEEVTASGTIYPENEVKISPDVSGEIIELYVEEGDTVKKGQPLVRINPDIYQTQLEQAKAGYNNAKASAANVEAQLIRTKQNVELQSKNYEMQKKLFKDKVISQQEYNNAEAQYEMAKAELKAAEKQALASQYNAESVAASVNQASKNYNRTIVSAPTDGIITGLTSKKGERVVGTAQMAGTQMMSISDLERMEVRVDVNENDIVRIKEGDSASIEIDAYQGKKFMGVVTQVANSSKSSGTSISTDQVTKYEVKVLILKSSYESLVQENGGRIPFRPGMSSTVHIFTKYERNVLAVPVASVTLKDKTDNSGEKDEVVFVVENGKAVKKIIKTDIQDTRYIKVLSGIKQGDVVIAAPYEAINLTINEGTKVNVVDKELLYTKEK